MKVCYRGLGVVAGKKDVRCRKKGTLRDFIALTECGTSRKIIPVVGPNFSCLTVLWFGFGFCFSFDESLIGSLWCLISTGFFNVPGFISWICGVELNLG